MIYKLVLITYFPARASMQLISSSFVAVMLWSQTTSKWSQCIFETHLTPFTPVFSRTDVIQSPRKHVNARCEQCLWVFSHMQCLVHLNGTLVCFPPPCASSGQVRTEKRPVWIQFLFQFVCSVKVIQHCIDSTAVCVCVLINCYFFTFQWLYAFPLLLKNFSLSIFYTWFHEQKAEQPH